MFSITTQGNKTMPYLTEFVADSESDLKKIDISAIAPGSTCIIIETSEVYILNNKKEWKPI